MNCYCECIILLLAINSYVIAAAAIKGFGHMNDVLVWFILTVKN